MFRLPNFSSGNYQFPMGPVYTFHSQDLVKEELYLAKIPLKDEVPKSSSPYINGLLNGWEFSRDTGFWEVSSPEGESLPTDKKVALYNKPYPIQGKSMPSTIGAVIQDIPKGNLEIFRIYTQPALNEFADLIRDL